MHKFIAAFGLSILTTVSFCQENIKKKIIINNQVELDIPADLPEPIEHLQAGLPTVWTIHKTDESVMLHYQLPDIADSTAISISDNDIPEWTDKQLAMLKKSPSFEFIDDGIFLQDGKNIGYIKYTSKINDGSGPSRYHLMFFTSVNNRLFQATFSCRANYREKWQKQADEIANSLRVKQ